MLKETYNDYGVQVLVDKSKYYLRYDAGSIATQIREIPVSYREAQYVMSLQDRMKVASFLRGDCYDRWKNPKQVTPSEYVGDTLKLMMG